MDLFCVVMCSHLESTTTLTCIDFLSDIHLNSLKVSRRQTKYFIDRTKRPIDSLIISEWLPIYYFQRLRYFQLIFATNRHFVFDLSSIDINRYNKIDSQQ